MSEALPDPDSPAHRPSWRDRLGFTPSSYRFAGWLFPRLLAAIYAIALLSWNAQLDGLTGDDGILPTATLLENIAAFEEREERSLFWSYPSLFHWHYSDGFAHGICWVGTALALLVMLGFLQGPLLLLLWFLYLSIASTAQVWLGFQWDTLLLEAGLLGALAAPWRFFVGRRPPAPPRAAVFLLHWLAFRLMFLSGYVKIAGGDAVWEDMTALQYHFMTQPLPNALAWSIHHLPEPVLQWGCRLMYVIELVLPFCLFLGRWGRLLAGLGFIALMLGVYVSGSYNFFNLLTIALALTLFDDRLWPHRLRRWFRDPPPLPRLAQLHRWTVTALAIPIILISLLVADQALTQRTQGWEPRFPPSWSSTLAAPLQGLRSINSYGLFQNMTEERPEILIEVSDDGIFWVPVEFHWKPGTPNRRPGFAAPHQPRLDWQMWFAALYPGFDPRRDSQPDSPLFWFGSFLSALVEGREAVWDLVETPAIEPQNLRHIRARLYDYRFTTPEEKAESGDWWSRRELRPYSPTFRYTPQEE